MGRRGNYQNWELNEKNSLYSEYIIIYMYGNVVVKSICAISMYKSKSEDQKRELSDQRIVVNGSRLLRKVMGAAPCPPGTEREKGSGRNQ